MRTFLTLFFFIIFIVNSKAQGIKITEDFESNTLGWTEVMDAKGQAIISEGVMQIESKGEEYWSTAWTDLDPSAPFEITVDVKVISNGPFPLKLYSAFGEFLVDCPPKFHSKELNISVVFSTLIVNSSSPQIISQLKVAS